ARGDRVSVMAVPFEPTALAQSAAGGVSSTEVKSDPVVVIERVSRPLIGVVAIVALLVVAFFAMRAAGSAPAPAARRSAPAAAEPAATNGSADHPALRSRLRGDGPERPESSAQVVRAWLAESS